MKNKKGILFTIVTVFLLISLFMLSRAFLDRNKELQTTVTGLSAGDKLRYIEDDIVSSIYSDLLWVNLSSVKRQDNNIIFNFSKAGKISPSLNYDSIMQDYESFVEGTYANKNNVNINLMNFNPGFNITNYNTFFDFANKLYIYNNPSYLNKIIIQIKANATTTEGNTTPTDDGGDYPRINVIVLNQNNDKLYEASPQLNPSKKQEFKIDLTHGKKVRVKFGTVEGKPDGTLIVDSNLYSEITSLVLSYDEINQKILIIADSNVSISSLGITKNTELVLYEE